jgi:hypothetical protein
MAPTPGAGEFGATGANRFFFWVKNWDRQNHDLSEEAWIAQEDLGIYRELFRLVKKANDYVANFQPVKDTSGTKDVPGKFRNPYWEIDVSLLGGNKVKVKLTNRLERLQSLDVYFRAQFQPGGPMVELGPFNAEPRTPAGTPKASHEQEFTVTGFAPKGVYAVRQVLTWETAAVKRIDQVVIGSAGGEAWALPHRLAHEKLVPFLKKEEPVAEAPPAEGGPMPMGDKGAMPGMMGGEKMGL